MFVFSSLLFLMFLTYNNVSLRGFFRPNDPCCAQYVSGRIPSPASLRKTETPPNPSCPSILPETRLTSLTFQFVGRRDEERAVRSGYSAVIWADLQRSYLWCVFELLFSFAYSHNSIALCNSVGKRFSISGHVCGCESPEVSWLNMAAVISHYIVLSMDETN